MINVHWRPAVNRVLLPVGEHLARAGVSPDAVTVIGTVGVCAGALAFFPRGSFFVGTLVITVFVFSDMIDGAIARARGTTGVWGAFLDSTLDRLGDAAIFGGLTMWYAGKGDDNLLAAVALYCLVTGAVTSYAKARAEGLGLTCNVGIAERSERLIIILVATGLSGLFDFPPLMTAALWVLAVLTTVTVVQRIIEVRRQAALARVAASEAP